MRCRDIMKSKVYCLGENDTIQWAARKMNEQNIGFLPVCNQYNRVVGTLTDRDIALRVCSDDQRASDVSAAQVMSREVIACSPDDELQSAETLMGQHQKSRVLVTEPDGTLVGVISLSDIVAREEPQAALRTMRAVSSREAQF